MTNRLMISVAALALMAGTGFANAQGASGGSSAQQSAPSTEHGASDRGSATGERGAATGQTNHDAAKPEMKSTQSDQKSPAAGTNQRADENVQGSKSKSMNSENADKANGNRDMKAEGRDGNKDVNKDMKAEGRQDRNGNMNAETRTGTENRTVGQAGAGPRLSSEQRTKITTVIKEQHIQPVTNANFSISVGTRVPRDISFHPLPAEIVTVYPDWRGYEFVLVRDQIVVINPDTYEIVAVLDA